MQHQLTTACRRHRRLLLPLRSAIRLAVDNTLVTDADYTGPFCITAPSSPDLPGGGGYPVCGLYDIKPAASARCRTTSRSRATSAESSITTGLRLRRERPLRSAARSSTPASTCSSASRHLTLPILSGTTTSQADSPEARFCRTGDAVPPGLQAVRLAHLPVRASRQRDLSAQPGSASHRDVERAEFGDRAGARPQPVGRGDGDQEHPADRAWHLWAGYLNQLDLRLSRRFSAGTLPAPRRCRISTTCSTTTSSTR